MYASNLQNAPGTIGGVQGRLPVAIIPQADSTYDISWADISGTIFTVAAYVSPTANALPMGPTVADGAIAVIGAIDSPLGKTGQQTQANSLPVVLASDQTFAANKGTWTQTVVTPPVGNSASFTIIAANVNRRGLLISLYYTPGGQAISINLTDRLITIPSGGYWEMPSPITTASIPGLTEQANTAKVVINEMT
jgi:hypothetical protein